MSLRAQRGNLVAASTNAVASFRLPPMSLRPQRGNLVAASTNAVASFRLSPDVIASAARRSRSRIDQRGRQLPIVPQCHCERSAAISQPHRPTLTPASDCPPKSLRAQRGNFVAASTNAVASFRLSPNVIASAARQSRSHIDQRCRQFSVCLQMSLRAQRGNLVTASTNAVASIRLSPNVIASAARQSRSHIDQRCRQLPIAPNVIATAAWQSRSGIDQNQ